MKLILILLSHFTKQKVVNIGILVIRQQRNKKHFITAIYEENHIPTSFTAYLTPPSHLPPAAVTQALHDRVDLGLKHLGQLGAELVDAGRLAVVEPGVAEHHPDIVNVLPGLLVLTCVQLTLYCGQVYWVLNNVKVVLQ